MNRASGRFTVSFIWVMGSHHYVNDSWHDDPFLLVRFEDFDETTIILKALLM